MFSFLKKTVLAVCYGLRTLLDPMLRFQEVSVLCYHSVSDSEHETALSPEVFKQQLHALEQGGWEFVSLADVVAWSRGEKTLSRKAVALTFDDGYADFETNVLSVLEHFSAPAAVFVMQNPEEEWDAPLLTQDALLRVKAHPLVELGYHSKSHPNLIGLSSSELAEQLRSPWETRYFAYPGGNHSLEAARAVQQAGYEAAFTIRPVLVQKGMDPYLLPRSVVLKGMSVWQVKARASKAADWYRRLKEVLQV